MKKMKKTLCLFLALVMCLGMVNLSAFADEGETVHEHNQLDCATCDSSGRITNISSCPDCGGEIAKNTCEACGGEGTVTRRYWTWDVPCPNNGEACSGCEDCNSGYAWLYENETCSECNGTGEIPAFTVETSPCEACGGEGAITRRYWTWDVPCPNNGEACNGCEDCNHGYAWIYETVLCTTCDGWGTIVTASDGACTTCGGRGEVKESYECDVCGGTGKVDCDGEFAAGELVKNEDGTGTVTYTCEACGASYDESRTHAEVVAALGDAGHVYSGEAIEHKDPTCAEDGYDKYVCTVDGCGAEFTVPVAKLKHSFQNHVCENCGAVSFTIYGSRMGYAYHYNGNPNAGAESYGYTGTAFGEGHALTMENLGLVDDKFGMFGEFVTNYATSKSWQCVGFVPAGSDHNAKDCLKLTYTNSENVGDFQYAESLDAVKAIVAEKGGVLYGEAPVDNSFIGRSGIVAVWFVADTSFTVGDFGEYDLTIPSITTAPDVEPNSAGITVECVNLDDMDYDHASGTYTVDLKVTIGTDAPNDAHVNLLPAIQQAAHKINGIEAFQPGDNLKLSITIDNQSGREYTYVNDSAFLATVPTEVGQHNVVATGFDTFDIPIVEKNEYSYIPRRTNNGPLTDLLGSNAKDFSDEAVSKALTALGYKNGLADLGNYYLDWTNGKRVANGLDPIHSFKEMYPDELRAFTNGDNSIQVFESDPTVAAMLYYFYYDGILDYNGMSIYDHMGQINTGKSELETAIPAALAGTPYVGNKLSVAGERAGNAFQNTQFSFRMEFDLSYTPEPVTPPPVSTPHYYYQLITYYITHLADGTIRYDGVNVQQVEVTEGKHNEVYTANEGDAGKYFFAASDYTEYKDNSYSFIPGYTPEDSKYRDSVHEIKLTEPNTRRNPYTLVMWYERMEIEEEPTPLSTTLTVEKVWEGDGDVQRPANVTVQLMKDGAAEGAPIVLSEANEWSYTWIALDAQSTWTVAEVDVPEGYTSSSSTNEDGTIVTITNTYTPTDVPDEEPPKTDTPDEPVDVPDEQPPLTDLPDEQPPLAEIPVEWPPLAEIPVEQPPLVEVPEDIPLIPAEPEVTVPEEPVPMVGIPQTGDFSMVWYAVAILSALGLAVLTLKKREGEEG